jgi:RNA polymerase sigma-70 factor (ECF subfamily)
MGTRQATFEGLYRRHSGEILAAVCARGMNAELARDCMQEAFLRLWQQWQRGEDIRNARAWLLRVARNLAHTDVRSAFRRYGTSPPQLLGGLPGQSPPPLDRLERQESSARVREALGQLRDPDRHVLTLRYALGYTTPQIARLLGVPATAVNMRLSRARQRLAEHLLDEGGLFD